MEKVTVQMLLCLFLFNTPCISQERIVEISGRKYNILTKDIENRSAKDAVVVFESGMGVDLGNWNKIIDQVSQFAPVFAYDRAGIGKSEKTYQLPTPENVAANLNTILKTLKILPHTFSWGIRLEGCMPELSPATLSRGGNRFGLH